MTPYVLRLNSQTGLGPPVVVGRNAQSLKPVKLLNQQLRTFATTSNRVRKRTQHVTSNNDNVGSVWATMLRPQTDTTLTQTSY